MLKRPHPPMVNSWVGYFLSQMCVWWRNEGGCSFQHYFRIYFLCCVSLPSSSQQRSLTPKALAACKRALDFIVALYPGLLTLAFVACSSNTGKPDRTESRPGWYHPNTYHNNFTILSGYRCYHDKSEVYVTCTNMHDYIKFSAKKKTSILTFSGNRHALLWFTMYPAKLKAHSEGTDVAGTFFQVLTVESVYSCSLSTT